jgi:hypothetical protein
LRVSGVNGSFACRVRRTQWTRNKPLKGCSATNGKCSGCWVDYLQNDIAKDQFISEIIEMLDGPLQRERTAAALEALEEPQESFLLR